MGRIEDAENVESAESKLVLVTGISGCGRKEPLEEFARFAAQRGKKVKTYFVGDMMFEHAKKVGVYLTKENVLNASPSLLDALRGAVFERILAQLPVDMAENDVVIISMHAVFFWKKMYIRSYDRFYIDKIRPDIFITFINSAGIMKEQLDKRKQWQQQNLSIEEILLWQNVEVEMTAGFSEIERKPFFIMPSKQCLNNLYKLIFCPNMEPVYASFPMTHLKDEKARKRIDNFVNELGKYFTVFDPRLIEISTSNPDSTNNPERNKTIFYQTVKRDLYWYIKQSKKIIAFFPSVAFSTGVINELREAYETNKDVWLIFPQGDTSPFTLYFCNRLFNDEKEFFSFLKEYIKEKYGK